MKLYAALVGLSIIWGMSFLFIKILTSYTGAWEIVFLRCSFGAIPLYAVIVFNIRRLKLSRLPWKPLVIVGLMNAAIPWTLIALSETTIRSSTASILNATTPIWTSVVGFALFSVRLSLKQWVGIFVGFVGILLLMNFDITDLLGDDFVGIGTMVLASLCYGFASQFTKRFLSGVPVLVIAAGTLTVGMIVSAAATFAANGFSYDVFTAWPPAAAAVGLGVFGSGVAYLLFFFMVQQGSAEFATYVTYLVPVTAMFWGWWLLDEPLSANLIAGLLLIFAGVYLSGKRNNRKDSQNEAQQTAAYR
ncbi:MAG TPA: DMT family transporter [Bacillales bacterium]|nr:DMT family transporter [Bacillales bacterium]